VQNVYLAIEFVGGDEVLEEKEVVFKAYELEFLSRFLDFLL